MNKVYYAKISDVIDATIFDKLLTFVFADKQEKILKFHSDIDKKLSLYSEILIRIIICSAIHVRIDEIVFEKNENGKPGLAGRSDLHFNLSHTRNAIVVAVSDEPIGIDIERIEVADLQIAKRFFTEAEVAYITKSIAGTDERFYEIWTKKESYIKYIGKGLSMSLKSFNVLEVSISKQMCTFEKDEYLISVCGEYAKQSLDIIELTEHDIENRAIKSVNDT